jgi:RNA methyltransferase, TrmH family
MLNRDAMLQRSVMESASSIKDATSLEVDLLRKAAKDKSLVLLEGFHSVKHALRFGADILIIATTDAGEMHDLATALAPDVLCGLIARARLVRRRDVDAISMNRSHWTGVWGVARRPATHYENIRTATGMIVLLEEPRNLGNLGACVRVSAAAGAAGVVILGNADPWEPASIRGGAGLQFALPVTNITEINQLQRPIIAIDPEGADLADVDIPANAALAFGTEREGLSETLLRSATEKLRIPMREGVSSINLAVCVGIVLYAQRLRTREGVGRLGLEPRTL